MSADDPDDFEDDFEDSIAAYEAAEPKALFGVLTKAGVALPPPDELDDSQVTAKLWEVINALAGLGAFLHSTNHLSDRELYAELWGDSLREEAVVMPGRGDYAWHIDLLGSGEDIALHMKYYADEDERRQWLKEWPKDVLPEREEPPYDRDRLLPQAEDRTDEPLM